MAGLVLADDAATDARSDMGGSANLSSPRHVVVD